MSRPSMALTNNNRLYYQSSEASAIERNVYSIKLNGSSKVTLAGRKGTNNATFTPDMRLFVNTFSAEGQPTRVTLVESRKGEEIRTIKTNERAEKALETYTYTPKEFFTVSTPSGGDLNAWMIKPVDFDERQDLPPIHVCIRWARQPNGHEQL